jgi:hypothetical protein
MGGLTVGFCIFGKSPSVVSRTSDYHVHNPPTKTIPGTGINLKKTVGVEVSTWQANASVLIPVSIHNAALIFSIV